MLDALAFLPEADLPQAMAYLQTHVPEVDRLAELPMYFDSMYVIGAVRRSNQTNDGCLLLRLRRSPPIYPPSVWNLHTAILTGVEKTNNVCEGWNNSFRALVGHQHPALWTLLGALQQDEAMAATAIEQYARGQPPTKRQKRSAMQQYNLCCRIPEITPPPLCRQPSTPARR